MIRSTKARAVAAAAALALLGTACGGEVQQVSTDTSLPGSSVDDPPAARLAAAAEVGSVVTSGRFAITFTMAGMPDLPGEITFAMDGAFDGDGRASMSMDLGPMMEAAMAADPSAADDPFAEMFSGMFDEPIEIVVDGETTYVKMGFLASFLGADAEWISMPTEGDASDVTGFGFPGMDDPTGFLEALRGIGADIDELGTAEVNGVEATGYRVLVDLRAAAAAEGADDEALDELLDGFGDVAIPFEVWLTDDGLPVRVALSLSGEELAAIDVEGELAGGSMEMVIDFSDFGEDVTIEVPDPSEVTDAGSLGGGFGGFEGFDGFDADA